ncbi:MAG: hypothetical protein KC561_05120 [Myxococcales bacterium]|nr:hypothetical protein [Myxococcales bacterium]
MSDERKFCPGGGRVVSSRYPIAASPAEVGGGSPAVGCSNIRCKHCGAIVKEAAGVNFPPNHYPSRDEICQAYESFDTSELLAGRILRESAERRLYICRCQQHAEGFIHTLNDTQGDESILVDGWACAGHIGNEQ